MKRLLIAIIVMAAAWSGYWLYASTNVRLGFETWFKDRRAAGWVADYSKLEVSGFPNRVDTNFTDLMLADPASGWSWEAPFFQLMALSYKPNHVIAAWPNEQVLATPLSKLDVTSARLQASVVLDADQSLPLNRANLVADTLTLQERGGHATTMTALRAAVQTEGEALNTYRFAIEAEDFAPPMTFRDLFGTASLPRTFDALRAQLSVTFNARWDRGAIEYRRPQPTRIELKLAEARWGDLELWLAGHADVDDEGRLNGLVTIKARNWREIIAAGINGGQIPASLGKQLEDALGLLSQLAGNPNTLDIPLTFSKGTAYLGPVPIGKMPRLVLR